MKTVVLQTFREHDTPGWMARCMASVRAWALARGYDHDFRGDAVFDLCGDSYLAAAGGNKRTITNLARLEWIRASLHAGYDRAIWLDADTFIFDPDRFSLDVRSGYACGLEVWVDPNEGRPIVRHGAHNAAMVFVGPHPDLTLMIDLIRHIAATRPVETSWQVGVQLLTGLHAGLRFPLLTHVGMLSPSVVRALATGRTDLPRLMARETGHPIQAANLCWSLRDAAGPRFIERAMDRLESSRGAVINRHLAKGAPAPLTVAGFRQNARPRLGLGLAQWLILRAIPVPLKNDLRALLMRVQ
jgi:hypothetical protein